MRLGYSAMSQRSGQNGITSNDVVQTIQAMTWRGNLNADARSLFNSILETVYRTGNEIKGGSAGKQPTEVEIEYAEQSTSGIRHVQRVK